MVKHGDHIVTGQWLQNNINFDNLCLLQTGFILSEEHIYSKKFNLIFKIFLVISAIKINLWDLSNNDIFSQSKSGKKYLLS